MHGIVRDTRARSSAACLATHHEWIKILSCWRQSPYYLKQGDGPATPSSYKDTMGETPMADLITVHDPRGYAPKVTGKRLANRLPSLDGKIVYLVDCLFDNSAAFIEQLRQWFETNLPKVETRIIRPRESWVDDPDMRKTIAANGSAAILGVGL
jgi:hypothetical protein